MPTIEDKELRDLFRIESAEHLQNIDAGLLKLEKNPADKQLLEDVFRDSHSLKGSARMLGLLNIQNLAHEIEDTLGKARENPETLDVSSIAQQLKKLDLIRGMVAEAVGDAPPSNQDATNKIDLAEEEIKVKPTEPDNTLAPQAEERRPEPSVKTPEKITVVEKVAEKVEVTPHVEVTSPSNDSLAKPQEFHIDTLRVDAKKLDALLLQTSELLINKRKLESFYSALLVLTDKLGANIQGSSNYSASLNAIHEELENKSFKFSTDLTELDGITQQIESSIYGLRLLPISTLLDMYPRMVHDLAAELKKEIEFSVIGGDAVADKRIIEEMKAPLMHLLRNSIDHGIESPEQRLAAGKPSKGQISIKVSQEADALVIYVEDDGRGLDFEAIKERALKQKIHTKSELENMKEDQLKQLIFSPGFSTSQMITDISGRGVGLKVVTAGVEKLQGTISIDSVANKGMSVKLRLPVSLISSRVMMVQEEGKLFAIPFDHIKLTVRLDASKLTHVEDRDYIYHNEQPIQFQRLRDIFQLPQSAKNNSKLDEEKFNAVIVELGASSFAIGISELTTIQDVVIKPPPAPLKRINNVLGFTLLETGVVCTVLNVVDIQRHMQKTARSSAKVAAETKSNAKKVILLAEDSITTRIQEKRILESAGYEVVAAIDGLDAWNKLSTKKFDAIVSDIMMPNISGLELLEKVRSSEATKEIPVVLVTSLSSDKDRKKGLDLGANAYISKPEFDQTLLLECLNRLI